MTTNRTSQNDESSLELNDEEAKAASTEGISQCSSKDTPDMCSLSDDISGHPKVSGRTSVDVKYGEFPHPDLCRHLWCKIRETDFVRGRGFAFAKERVDDVCSAWLKKKRLVFARDERYSFAFDNFAIASYQRSSKGHLDELEHRIKELEDFVRKLRKKGGFFFFRESYGFLHDYNNKVYNGTHVFRCKDRMNEALPIYSNSRRDFCENNLEEDPQYEDDDGDDTFIRIAWEKRMEMTESIEGIAHGTEKPLEPCLTYYYTVNNRRRVTIRNGFVMRRREICAEYGDLHISAPWRRLW